MYFHYITSTYATSALQRPTCCASSCDLRADSSEARAAATLGRLHACEGVCHVHRTAGVIDYPQPGIVTKVCHAQENKFRSLKGAMLEKRNQIIEQSPDGFTGIQDKLKVQGCSCNCGVCAQCEGVCHVCMCV
jgi:hypothetical protein